MDRTERFYKIKELLQTVFEVSRSTLKRDLNYLSTGRLILKTCLRSA